MLLLVPQEDNPNQMSMGFKIITDRQLQTPRLLKVLAQERRSEMQMLIRFISFSFWGFFFNMQYFQRRGLNQTGKATKSEVKTAVLKAGQQKVSFRFVTKCCLVDDIFLKRPRPNSAGSSGSLAKLGGLKISFKPKELAKTTEKGVSQQVC
jgi:hypothetical protein